MADSGFSDGYRLPPERSLRLYSRVARDALRFGEIGLALAAISNVLDALARLQEHHVRREQGFAVLDFVLFVCALGLFLAVAAAYVDAFHGYVTGLVHEWLVRHGAA